MKLTLFDKHGIELFDFYPSESSTHDWSLMSDNKLSVDFESDSCVNLSAGCYVEWEGVRYYLLEEYKPTMLNSLTWKYSVTFKDATSWLSITLALNTIDGQNKPLFKYTAPASEHIAIIVANLNRRMGVTSWKVGSVISTENITIDYSGKYCSEVLQEIVDDQDTEWWADGMTLNVGRAEFGDPIELGYRNGLLGDIKCDQADNMQSYAYLYPIGSTRNIDPTKYGYDRLQLPGGQTRITINEQGVAELVEESAFAHIFPHYEGSVSSVRTKSAVDDGKQFTIYYISDSNIPFNPNDYEIAGLKKQITFLSGELAGADFEVNYDSNAREFEIITQWSDDGFQLPGDLLIPKNGDKYVVWNITMPAEYYPMASQEFLEAAQAFAASAIQDVSIYKCPLDYIEVQKRGMSIRPGRRVRLLSNEYFPKTGFYESRITRITRSLWYPEEARIDVSAVRSMGTISRLTKDVKDNSVRAKQLASSYATISATVLDLKAEFEKFFAYDSENNAIHAKLSLWSSGGITAGGVGTGGSGGGGGGASYDRLDSWDDYAPDKVLSALLGKQMYDRIGVIEGAGYATEAWVLGQIANTPTFDPSGYAKESWVLSQGYITQSALAPYALTSDLANYQPLATAINTSNIGSQSVAYATSADRANQLAAPRTIWGQSFDGSADVSGKLQSDIWRILKDSNYNGTFIQSKNYYGNSDIGNILISAWGGNRLNTFQVWAISNYFTGKVGIGISSPSEDLEVDGNVKATSFIGNLTGNAGSATRLLAYQHNSGGYSLVSGVRTDGTLSRSIYDNGRALIYYAEGQGVNAEIATINSNVASASKLANPRTIWGKSFDGTKDVSGNIVLGAASDYFVGSSYDTDVPQVFNKIVFGRNTTGLEYYSGGWTSSYVESHKFYVGGSNFKALVIGNDGIVNISKSLSVGENISATSATFNSLTIGNGITLTYDSANNALCVNGNLYSLGGITAGGVGNGTSGGGSSYERLDDWANYAPEKVLSALLGKQMYDRIGTIEGAGYATESYVLGEIAKIPSFDPLGLATESWVLSQGYITQSALTPYFLTSSFTKENIKSTLGISDWALANDKPVRVERLTNLDSAKAWYYFYTGFQPANRPPSANYFTGITFDNYDFSSSSQGQYYAQLAISHDARISTRYYANGFWRAWCSLAFIDEIPTKLSQLTDDVVAGNYQPLATAINTGNIGSQSVAYATSAGKLAIPRTIWGQSFDGTGNVSGDITLGATKDNFIGSSYEESNPQVYNKIVFGRNNTGLEYHSGGWTSSYVESHKFYVGGSNFKALVIGNDGIVNISKSLSVGENISATSATFNSLTIGNGITLTYDSANNALCVNGNLYSLGGITAGGVGNAQIVALEQRISNLEAQIVSLTNQISA